MTEPLLDVRQVSASHGAVAALSGISLTVGPGEIVALLGANGAGKTTTLRTLTGLHPTASGETLRFLIPESAPLALATAGSEGTQGWFDAIPGERMRVRIGGNETGNALSILESIVSPNAATPLHYHAAIEIFLVASGRLRLVCGGQGLDLDAGSSAVVPSGAHHGFVNLSGGPVRLLAIFSPGGVDRLFAQLAATPPEQWSDLARRFDTVIVGPPVTG